MKLKNGVWVHQIEFEAFKRLARVCEESVDAKSPGTAEWQNVRDALYELKNAWLDIEERERTIRELLALEEELSQ